MTNFASNQNEQALMHAQEPKGDVSKKQSRKSWLSKAAITVTSAIMLLFVLSGCTKEQWDDIIPGPPGGGVGGTPDQTYNLRIIYKDRDNQIDTGYMAIVDDEDAINPDRSYMKITSYRSVAAKIKLDPAEDKGSGWNYWQVVDDGNWLTMTGIGWVYRWNSDYKAAWKITDGKMFTDYISLYAGAPLGTAWYSFGEVSPAYYIGATQNGSAITEAFTCELVPAQ